MSSASSSSSSFTTFDGSYDLVLETTTPLRLTLSSKTRRLYNLSMDSSHSFSSMNSPMSSPSVYSVEDSPKQEFYSPSSLDGHVSPKRVRPLPSLPASAPPTSHPSKTLRPLPLPPSETKPSISVCPASPTSDDSIPRRDVESPYPLLPNPHIHPPPRMSSRHRANPFSSLSLDVSEDTLAPPAYQTRSKDTLFPTSLAPSPSQISLAITEVPTPTTDRRRRISRLRRRLGDGVPDELVPYKRSADGDKGRMKSLRETQSQDDLYSLACRSTLAFGEDLESDEEDEDEDNIITKIKVAPRSSSRIVLAPNEKITKKRPDKVLEQVQPESAPASTISYRARSSNRISTKWVREKGGRRWEEQDYAALMNALRAL